MLKPIIEFNGVTKVFSTSSGPIVALRGVSFQIAEGEFVSLIGPSGCGKSTILRLITEIHHPTEGVVRVAGLTPEQARKGNKVNLMFQEPVLLPWLNVYKNVTLALEFTCPADHPDPMWLLGFVGLKGRENAYPHQLSGGMQQRVALARAMVTNPDILLMDEPFGALDELTRDRMGQWLLSIWEQTKKTVVFVTHSIPEALYLSDRVLVMDANPGRIMAAIEVTLPRPRNEAVRESIEFFEMLQTLRSYLQATGVDKDIGNG